MKRNAVLPFVLLLVVALAWSQALRAESAADIAAIHAAAVGGAERIAALQSLRATGEVTAGGKTVRFVLWAARPNRVRVETTAGGRKVVQGSDGIAPAWEQDLAPTLSRARVMAAGAAKTFMADAEFDDPLSAGAGRGYVLDFGGEGAVDGRKVVRVLVTRRGEGPVILLVDATTYLIVGRTETRETAGGRRVPIVTSYGEFRPVAGVLLPHQITVAVDGRVAQETKIERIEANPPVAAEAFAAP